MSAFLLKSDKIRAKILHGSDTDVSFVTIINLGGPNSFIVLETFIEVDEIDDKCVKAKVLTRDELDEEFNAQLGTPMQYITQADYDEFIAQYV